MAAQSALPSEVIEALRGFDTCMVSNAIESFEVRLRNTGFANAQIRCMFPDLPPIVGYAATARLRSDDPPVRGGSYRDHSSWWKNILQIPEPRIVVLQDMDKPSGVGAFLGDTHAAILRALGCIGCVTDGAVRELPRVHDIGLQLFAGTVSVSHAYAHLFDFGDVVKVAGLEVHPGDLLHGDQHGLLNVPLEIASRIPAVAEERLRNEKKVIDFCLSSEFSLERLRQVLNLAP